MNAAASLNQSASLLLNTTIENQKNARDAESLGLDIAFFAIKIFLAVKLFAERVYMNNDRFKFRVFDPDYSEFVTGSHVLDCDGELCEYSGGDFFGHNQYEDNLVIQQCTGLKDKNGKLIFEGDLLKHPNQKELGEVVWDEVATSFRVRYENSWLTFALFLQIDDRGQAVVIGNIFENKELLE